VAGFPARRKKSQFICSNQSKALIWLTAGVIRLCLYLYLYLYQIIELAPFTAAE